MVVFQKSFAKSMPRSRDDPHIHYERNIIKSNTAKTKGTTYHANVNTEIIRVVGVNQL